MEYKVNTDNFEAEVLKADGYVLVDFWAVWCGPCSMLSPIVSEIAEEGEVKVCRINVDENIALAQQYGINAIPALLLFKGGKVVNQSIGVVPKDEITKMWK